MRPGRLKLREPERRIMRLMHLCHPNTIDGSSVVNTLGIVWALYPSLRRLEAAGLIKGETLPTPLGRRIYRLTPAGLECRP